MFQHRANNNPVLVHSDLAQAVAIGRGLGLSIQRDGLLNGLLETLESILDITRQAMVFPAYNYDFAATKVFDLQKDPVQVGAFPEMLRQAGLFRRTPVPFFSFLTQGSQDLSTNEEIDPFGAGSLFDDLVRQEGSILLLGAGINTLTFIHHIESSHESGPLYRYDKVFNGQIVNGSDRRNCSVTMHVRPRGLQIQYDWQKIASDLFLTGAMVMLSHLENVALISASDAKQSLLNKLDRDPLYPLTAESRESLSLATRNGRRLTLEDFE